MSGERKFRPPAISQVEALSAKLIELNLRIEEKNRQLEQSEQARKNMFSNITHDLRAPVSAIRGAVERLCQGELGAEERAKMIRIIDSRSNALEGLIEDLYLSILIDQPEFALSLSCLEIAPILEEYFISMEGAGRLGGRESDLCVPDGLAACVMIDPQYFLRVLDNLLSNALRHTEPGDQIKLGCRERGGCVEVFLTDSGEGIPAEDLPHIFDRTFTGAAARTPGKTGSGLGLSISKTIVEKHGGFIYCDSAYGEGSTFIISLPSVTF